MQMILFTVVGIVLYLAADRILNALELRAGRRLEHRSLIFFCILLPLALATFALLQRFVPGD